MIQILSIEREVANPREGLSYAAAAVPGVPADLLQLVGRAFVEDPWSTADRDALLFPEVAVVPSSVNAPPYVVAAKVGGWVDPVGFGSIWVRSDAIWVRPGLGGSGVIWVRPGLDGSGAIWVRSGAIRFVSDRIYWMLVPLVDPPHDAVVPVPPPPEPPPFLVSCRCLVW